MKSWVVTMFTSSLGQKYVMSLTGLFLCAFLVIHLSGNLLTLIPDGGLTFNSFTHFMEGNLLIRTLEYILFLGFIIHIIQAIVFTRKNQVARPEKYAVAAGSTTSAWNSRNMGLLGTLIFIFLVIHMRDFFYEILFKADDLGLDSNGHVNLYSKVVQTFGILPYTVLYVASMIALGFHLWHGFQSAFRSIGVMHSKYTPAIVALGRIYTIVITAGFIIIPVYWYFKQL